MSFEEPALSLVGGEPLTPERATRLPASGTVRLMVDRPAVRPVDVGDVVEIVRGGHGEGGDLVVCIRDNACELARLIRAADSQIDVAVGRRGEPLTLAPDAILGVVTALEQGDLLFDLSRGRWRAAGKLAAMLPPPLGGLLTLLARLERLRRPLFPPLSMGGENRLLSQLASAYDTEVDVIARETALLPDEEALLERYLAPGQRLLDVGCGAGREAIGFARAGLRVVGIDVAPTLIARARERARDAGLEIEFAVGEPLTWAANGAAFDAIYFSPGIYSHIPGRKRRVRTLIRLRDLLTPGGFIVVGPVLAPPRKLLSRSRVVDALRRVGLRCGLSHLAEPGDHYHRGHALGRTPVSYRYLHRFRDHAEAEAELADAGLVVTDRLDETCWIARARRP